VIKKINAVKKINALHLNSTQQEFHILYDCLTDKLYNNITKVALTLC